MSKEYPERGDWFSIQYGSNFHPVYVLGTHENMVEWCKTTWCVSDAQYVTRERFLDMYGNSPSIYLGKSKERWWWRFLPWRDVVPPFARPKRK